ncbi:MAG TPA: DNA-3-methyladenine glycosylase [Terriglobales bacterium]|nr:DNA-3-methyladenine glycosylase [Terriglobales bacterium]
MPRDIKSAASPRLRVEPSVVPRAFYDRDTRRVARALLGKVLVRRAGRRLLTGRIVETEAYLGAEDAAAHSAPGPTARNRVIFGPPGHAYVYFIYGNHYCLNVNCLPEGEAGCVLIRALEPLAGLEHMARNRGLALDRRRLERKALETGAPRLLRQLTTGPGRLCEAFAITRQRDNGKDVTSPRSDLTIADDGVRPRRILTTPRIGITKSADEMLRYVIEGNPFVSGPVFRTKK